MEEDENFSCEEPSSGLIVCDPATDVDFVVETARFWRGMTSAGSHSLRVASDGRSFV